MNRIYQPNKISATDRIICTAGSLFLITYGTFGLYIDDFYIPGKHGKGVHLHGEPVWIMYMAVICATANLVSVVIDHYDKRNNENNYKLFARLTQIAGWTFFILAMTLDLLLIHKGDW